MCSVMAGLIAKPKTSKIQSVKDKSVTKKDKGASCSKKVTNSTMNQDEEPLLDYEDYFKNDHPVHKDETIKKKEHKGKKLVKKEIMRRFSVADMVSSGLSELRQSVDKMEESKVVELRKRAQEQSKVKRQKCREEILGRRRWGIAVAGEGDTRKWVKHDIEILGERDPDVHVIIWELRRFHVTERVSSHGQSNGKRRAPSVDRTDYYCITQHKRCRAS